MTYTYALLPISKKAYDEIRLKLKEASYDRQIDEIEHIIDMHGIAVTPEWLKEEEFIEFTTFLEALHAFSKAPTYLDIDDDTIIMADYPNHFYLTAGEIRALKKFAAKELKS